MEVSPIKAEVIDNIKVEDNVIGDKAGAAETSIGGKHKLAEESLKFSVGEIKTEDDENGSSSNKKIKSEVDYDDVKDDEELEEKKPEDDPYAYIKLGHFTCEIYKMELGNLPRFISYTCLKKLIEKNCKVKPHKIKVIKEGNKPYSFISFKSADDRDKAIGIMNGLTWKKQKLYAKRANPAKDPLIKRRLEEDLSTEPEIGLENIADAGDRLNDKICPLWRTPYDEQLKIKAENYLAFLISLRKDIIHLTESPGDTQFNTIKWANEIGEQNNGSICPIEEIKPSPVTSGYRNKCEFSIGPGKIVGFRLGLYKEGSLSVITPPENCPIVSSKIRNIVLLFQDYLQTRDFDAFNNVTHEGVWRQLTVRATDLGAMLIIAQS
uniref:RRM domain-containing protein n=1 Tax=Tetranychus urticae TaxID=32264 RepID=T1KTW8_TETUR